MSELPQGWIVAALAEFLDILRGVTFTKAERRDYEATGYIACLRTSNVQRTLEIKDLAYIPIANVRNERQFVQEGDVIVSMSNSHELVGKAAIAEAEHHGMTFGAFLAALRSSAIEPRFLLAIFRSERFLRDLRTTASQTVNIANISAKRMAGLDVALPPLPEQRRIVAKIDSLSGKSGRARDHLDHIPRLVEKYKQAVLAAAFQGNLTSKARAQKGWPRWKEVSVADVAISLFDGPFGSNLKTSDYTGHGVRVVRLENIGHLQFNLEKETYISQERHAALLRHTLKAGDVLVSSFVADRMRVCLFPGNLPTEAINKADCFSVRSDPSVCLPSFLELRLASPDTFSSMRAVVHGATRPRISLSQLKTYRFDIPELDEQIELVKRTQSLFDWIDRLAAEAGSARRLIDRLDQAVLTKAFRGELVPQDPADEPASALLERIKAERAAAPKSQGRRRANTP